MHPQHATLEARLRTFREWPPALRQQPAELADAGFYYIGCSDQVRTLGMCHSRINVLL